MASQKSGDITEARARSNANLRPWKPGQSGNPGGRPKDAAKAVRERLGGSPELLVSMFLEIAEDPKQPAAARVSALRELYDRGWGKAPAFEAMKGQDPLGLSAVDEEIQRIAADLAKERDELAAKREQAA